MIQKSAGLPLPPQVGSGLPSPWLQRQSYHSEPWRTVLAPPKSYAPVGLESREGGTKEDYSWALRFNGKKKKSNEICLARLWTCLEPITPFVFPISPFWPGNICTTSVPPLYSGSAQLVWLHTFTAGEEFCLRMNCTSSLTHTWFSYLDETLGLS